MEMETTTNSREVAQRGQMPGVFAGRYGRPVDGEGNRGPEHNCHEESRRRAESRKGHEVSPERHSRTNPCDGGMAIRHIATAGQRANGTVLRVVCFAHFRRFG